VAGPGQLPLDPQGDLTVPTGDEDAHGPEGTGAGGHPEGDRRPVATSS
jgi:hypothetical protein